MIAVTRIPNQALEWSDFRPGVMMDAEDAHVDVRYHLSNFRGASVHGVCRIVHATVNVRAVCTCRASAAQTLRLRNHERGHFNIGILVARALARHLETLSASTPDDLQAFVNDAFILHRETRNNNVQLSYDTQTQHWANDIQQAAWDAAIASALSSPAPVPQLLSLDL